MAKTVLVSTSSFAAADPASKEALLRAGLTVRENPHRRKLTEAEIAQLLSSHRPAGLLAGMEPLTAAVLEGAKEHLKVISRCGVGLENVDLKAAARWGIRVFNTPDAPSQAVAELTVGLMLAVLRRVCEADRALRSGEWKPHLGALLGTRTVGVVGHGRIGGRVAQLCRAFGCPVLAHDPRPFEAPGVQRVSLSELLERSDVITLHAPGDRPLIGREALSRAKPGAVLINTARGGLVDEAALLEALESGRLSGAGLDALDPEPYSGALLRFPNVVCTPHMGSAARECRAQMEREAALNLIEGLRSAGEL